MLDASSGGALLSKSYEEGYNLFKRITANTYQLPITRAAIINVLKKSVGVHVVTDITDLAAQVAQIHQMVKNTMIIYDDLVKVVTDANIVAYVYYEGAHLFEEWSANPVFVNYVGNKKYNNPYNNTYNPKWHNYPKFSWSNTKNKLKPQAPQIPLVFLHQTMLWLHKETTRW